MDSGLAIALVVGLLVAVWFGWRARARTAAGAEGHLRRICFGDVGQVERLIEGEMRRAPGSISRAEAARRAVERHARDNR